jgi:hypothetical protein
MIKYNASVSALASGAQRQRTVAAGTGAGTARIGDLIPENLQGREIVMLIDTSNHEHRRL